jgi:signal transduction histidine kinase
LGIFLDITDRLVAEKQVRHAQRAKALGSLAGGVAHELNNLLLPISALSNMIAKRLPDDSRERSWLEKIMEASGRATEIVQQILTLSREEDEERKSVEVFPLISEIERFLTSSLPRNVKFECRADLRSGTIMASENQIRSAIVNLATNAVEALEEKPGQIVLALDRFDLDSQGTREIPELEPGAYARVTISDTGRGISSELIEHVLDPFFTTKECGKGIGMGLATVNAVVTRHDGTVRINSTLGEGTSVILYFPLTPAA